MSLLTTDQKVLEIVETIEAACRVIEAELEVINVDLQNAEDCCRRYGEVFLGPTRYLVQLRENKKMRYRELMDELEALRVQVEASNKLLAVLEGGGSNRPAAVAVSALYSNSSQHPNRSGGGGRR